MSRQFNGTTQALFAAVDLSGSASVTVAFWMWWDAFAQNDKLAMEYTANTFAGSAQGFIIDPNATNGGRTVWNFGSGKGTGGSWVDEFARPSAGVWHHYVFGMVRGVSNVAYVDGVLQTLSTTTHTGGAWGNFDNSTLNFMSRNHAALWGAGRMAEVAIWGGVILTARQALALSVGANPRRIGPVPTAYWPLLGGSPEPDYGGTQKGATLTATPTIVAHPPVRSFLRAA